MSHKFTRSGDVNITKFILVMFGDEKEHEQYPYWTISVLYVSFLDHMLFFFDNF